jgi:transposase
MNRNGNRERAVRLLEQGLPQRVVADKLGLARGTVASYRHWARQQGVKIPPRESGRPKAIIARLPVAVRRWLAAELPEGTTIEEMIAAIVVDAYHEEMGK